MMTAVSSIAGSATGAEIITLIRLWAPELGVEPRWLRDRIYEVCLHGLIDDIHLPDGTIKCGLICTDIATKQSDMAIRGTDLRDCAKKHADIIQALNIDIFRTYELNGQKLSVTREAVWHLSRHWKVKPPSFWPFPKTKNVSKKRPVNIVARLAAFHQGRPKETEPAARKAANEDEAIGEFTDAEWREAWAQRDPATKHGRGERLR